MDKYSVEYLGNYEEHLLYCDVIMSTASWIMDTSERKDADVVQVRHTLISV
jgi:hypothetical protein